MQSCYTHTKDLYTHYQGFLLGRPMTQSSCLMEGLKTVDDSLFSHVTIMDLATAYDKISCIPVMYKLNSFDKFGQLATVNRCISTGRSFIFEAAIKVPNPKRRASIINEWPFLLLIYSSVILYNIPGNVAIYGHGVAVCTPSSQRYNRQWVRRRPVHRLELADVRRLTMSGSKV